MCLHGEIDVFQSPKGPLTGVPRLNVHEQASNITKTYNLVMSIHCKQLFPPELINNVRCVNVHPGLNPYNRGWFPQVFSIINGLPSGVTIHEIDDDLDHGPIIVQKKYNIQSWDTSASAYKKIMMLENELVLKYYTSIREGSYSTTSPRKEGNINFKKDFDRLKLIDRTQRGTFGEFIDRLRALTHDDYKNAYFEDKSGAKVYLRISLETERFPHNKLSENS
jgi:dTDP-4-amino-4,6-dideoxyglucose formyltransferase